jgi:pantoate--beta-alanine ligase
MMQVITGIKEMQAAMIAQKTLGKTIGFVPTMGFLHEGHLTLIRNAKEQNDIVVLSIFVNPMQFGPGEDYETYPRNFERDRALASTEEVDYIFAPSAREMYPDPMTIRLTVQDRTDVLCGKSRPGHFDGVVTVVSKLFHIVMPTRAYFGKKDAQQIAVIERLIADLNFPIQIVPVDIVREADGLAKSSRNVNLSTEDRKQAVVLYKSLLCAKQWIEKGENNPEKITGIIKEVIATAPNAALDYVEVLSYPNLRPLKELTGTFIVAIAVKFPNVRLIDNLIIEIE